MNVSRKLLFIVMAASVLASCRSTRSARKIEQVITKKDTNAIVIVHPNEMPDSLVHLRNALAGMYSHYIHYTTFSAKVRVEYSNEQGSQPPVNATIRMKKDSIIWIDMTGPFDINLFQVLITPDSVRILDELDKTYKVRALNSLEELVQIPFDFKSLQDLVVGNPVFFDSARIASYRQGNMSTYLLSSGDLFKHLVSLSTGDYRVLHSKLDDADPTRNRTADLTYDDYVGVGNNMLFSTSRSVSFSEKTKVDVELNFKQFNFDVPLNYPFRVPKKYRRVP